MKEGKKMNDVSLVNLLINVIKLKNEGFKENAKNFYETCEMEELKHELNHLNNELQKENDDMHLIAELKILKEALLEIIEKKN